MFKSSEEGKEQDRSVILLVPRDALRDLMLQYPEMGLSVSRVLATRVRALTTLARVGAATCRFESLRRDFPPASGGLHDNSPCAT